MPIAERWFRAKPDSSVLDRPRVLTRRLIPLAQLGHQIALFETLLARPADLRMPIPDFGGLELCAVGGMLLIASERPFTDIQRRTTYSVIVPALQDRIDVAVRSGAEVVEEPEKIVPGARARLRYPDGTLAEFVEHRPQPGERPVAPGLGRAGEQLDLRNRRVIARSDLAAAVAFYGDVHGGGPVERLVYDGVELALLDGMLLIGADNPPATDDDMRFAFVARPSDAAGLATVPDPAMPGRALVRLPDGTTTECWDPTMSRTSVS